MSDGDFGGYYGRGPTTTWGAYVYAALSAGTGVFTIVKVPDAWWIGSLLIVLALFFIVLAHTRHRIQAWAKEKRRRKPGDPMTLNDLE